MTTNARPGLPPDRIRTTIVGLVLPLLLLAAAVVVVLSWPDLPDPVATHWSPSGVDGTGSLAGLVTLVALVGVASAVGGWALAFLVGRDAVVRRTGVGVGSGLTVFLAALLVGTLWIQRGLTDALDAPDADTAIYVALGLAVLVGGLGALTVRRDPPQPATPADLSVPPGTIELPPGRVVWVQETGTPALRWVGVGIGTVMVVTGVLVGLPWLLVPLGAFVAGLVVTFSQFTVVVDETGLRARGALAWPRFAVPADEVLDAQVTQVDPLRDFGGWGYRLGRGGRIGIVTRRGEAIAVERTGGRRLVVTVDDAATGAALLRAFAARNRTGR